MVDIIEWAIYIILAGFAITVWALVANNKKKLVIYKYKNIRYWPKAVIQHYFIIHQLEVVIS